MIVEKNVDEYAHPDSPMDPHQTVSGCKMNSLVRHPYNEALGNIGVPVGLVVIKDRMIRGGNGSEMTRDMIQNGGISMVPNLIDDSIFEKLFDAVSYKKKRVLTRKIKLKTH